MNESGMPAMPPQTPPSYLRPPVPPPPYLPGSTSRVKNSLIISAFILALIAIGIWTYITYGHPSAPPAAPALPESQLIFYSPSPVPNVYQYYIGKGDSAAILPPDYGTVLNGSLAPSQDRLALLTSSATSTDRSVVVVSLLDNSVQTLARGIEKGASFAWSADGTRLAYTRVDFSARKGSAAVPFPKPSGQNTDLATYATLSIANLATGKTSSYPVTGDPLAFSADNASLLVRNYPLGVGGFSILTTTTGSTTPLRAADYGSGAAAVSPDGRYLAYVLGDTIVWGEISWSDAAFAKEGSVQGAATGLVFDDSDNLLVVQGGAAKAYQLASSSAAVLGASPLSLPTDSVPLMWLNP